MLLIRFTSKERGMCMVFDANEGTLKSDIYVILFELSICKMKVKTIYCGVSYKGMKEGYGKLRKHLDNMSLIHLGLLSYCKASLGLA